MYFHLYLVILGKYAILVNFLEGKPKVNITHNDCYLIGDLIGNLQNKSRYCDLIRKNSLSLEDSPISMFQIEIFANIIFTNLDLLVL